MNSETIDSLMKRGRSVACLAALLGATQASAAIRQHMCVTSNTNAFSANLVATLDAGTRAGDVVFFVFVFSTNCSSYSTFTSDNGGNSYQVGDYNFFWSGGVDAGTDTFNVSLLASMCSASPTIQLTLAVAVADGPYPLDVALGYASGTLVVDAGTTWAVDAGNLLFAAGAGTLSMAALPPFQALDGCGDVATAFAIASSTGPQSVEFTALGTAIVGAALTDLGPVLAAATDAGGSADGGVNGDAGLAGNDAGSGAGDSGTAFDAGSASPPDAGTPAPPLRLAVSCGCTPVGQDHGAWLSGVLLAVLALARAAARKPPRVLAAAVAVALGLACAKEPRLDPAAEAEGLYVAATSEYLQGHFDTALMLYGKVAALRPDDARLAAALGEVYLAQRKVPEALKSFQRAAQADPRRATNWSRIGYLQSMLGQADEARTALRKSLALNPADFNALEELGELDVKDAQVDTAVAHFVLAAQVSPDLNKGRLYGRAAQLLKDHQRPEEALKLLEEALAMGVHSPEVWLGLGEGRVRAGDWNGAAAAYEQAARAQPEDPTLWELVGELQARQGRAMEAEAAFHQALQIGERALPHIGLARLRWLRADPAGAQLELSLALKSATGEEERESWELAELLGLMGRKADALKLLAQLASEPRSARNVALQLKTAGLARELREAGILRDACARIGDAGVRCP